MPKIEAKYRTYTGLQRIIAPNYSDTEASLLLQTKGLYVIFVTILVTFLFRKLNSDAWVSLQ